MPPEPPLQSLHILMTPSDPQPAFTDGICFPEGTSATQKHSGGLPLSCPRFPFISLIASPTSSAWWGQTCLETRDEVAGQGFELHLLACPWLPSVPLH